MTFHKRSARAAALLVGVLFCRSVATFAAETPLDRNLRTDDRESDEISNVFKEMGVVQKRAMPKGGRFLLSTYGSFDFSDGPYTNYSLNINPGFAISDFFEIYINYVPMFFTSARSIVTEVSQLTLEGGQRATITAAIPQSQIGLELLWAPAYGKESLGLRAVMRSDTFFKLGVAQTTYDTETGMKILAGVGKTFFLGRHAGFRLCVNLGMVQSTVQGNKAFRNMAILESGFNIYL